MSDGYNPPEDPTEYWDSGYRDPRYPKGGVIFIGFRRGTPPERFSGRAVLHAVGQGLLLGGIVGAVVGCATGLLAHTHLFAYLHILARWSARIPFPMWWPGNAGVSRDQVMVDFATPLWVDRYQVHVGLMRGIPLLTDWLQEPFLAVGFALGLLVHVGGGLLLALSALLPVDWSSAAAKRTSATESAEDDDHTWERGEMPPGLSWLVLAVCGVVMFGVGLVAQAGYLEGTFIGAAAAALGAWCVLNAPSDTEAAVRELTRG